MSPDARKAFNAAMSAYWGSKDDGASPGEAGFKAGLMEAARLCRERAADHDGNARSTFHDPRMHSILRDEVSHLADTIESHARGKT